MGTNQREEAVIQSAIQWWESMVSETEEWHIDHPTANTLSSAQAGLAEEVAKLVRARNVQARLPKGHPQKQSPIGPGGGLRIGKKLGRKAVAKL